MVTTVVVEKRPRNDEAQRKPQQARARAPQASQSNKAATTTELSESERNQQISLCAYFRAEQRGFAPGHMWDDWLAAEREVDARGALKAATAATQTKA
jgi:Protein of unknown function (DUF2934)